jgi:hypothetical protein
MGSRYLFILLYVGLEKLLVQRDYERLAKGATRRRPRPSQIAASGVSAAADPVRKAPMDPPDVS